MQSIGIGMKGFWEKHKEKFWAPVEVSLLFIALVSPVIFTSESSLKTELFGDTLVSAGFLEFEFEGANRSIASEVLQMPIAPGRNLPTQLVTVKQVRIELLHNGDVLGLHKQSLDQNEISWEELPLLIDKQSKKPMSTYIELDQGENVFRVEFVGDDGVVYNQTFVINQSRRGRT